MLETLQFIKYRICWSFYENHTKEFVNKENNVHRNTIEDNLPAIKIAVPKRCRNINHINMYLIKFMIKRNELENV
ncbi:hypothetical protein H311_04509 [Anncaliia algerae PRA109]|nr:hypothetical protein H311_04510 [Anncaliia algerae PRA109]KCZ74525.1 hypothetical protein H311_04509 [Anncaliia algerae PRA109]